MKKFVIAAAVAALMASPAISGSASMKNADGVAVKIACKGSGCTVKSEPPGGKWARVEKTPGGTKNYKALVDKYTAMGYSQ